MPKKPKIFVTNGSAEVIYLPSPPPVVKFQNVGELIEALHVGLITQVEARAFLGFDSDE